MLEGEGLWRMVSSNIGKVAGFLPVYNQLTEPDRSDTDRSS